MVDNDDECLVMVDNDNEWMMILVNVVNPMSEAIPKI